VKKITVIGIGFKPLSNEEKLILERANIVLSFERTAEIFKEKYGELFETLKNKIKICKKLEELISGLKKEVASQRSCVVLADGDPLLFGIGKTLLRYFSKDVVEIFPDLSSLQVAGARLKKDWWSYAPFSLHGKREEFQNLLYFLMKHRKVAIFTDEKNSPKEIASFLLSKGIKSAHVWVCERLGFSGERLCYLPLEEVTKRDFSFPNIVFLELRCEIERCFGLSEGEFFHLRGMITKDEVRAVVLHKLEPSEGDVFWDVGAGSGSVSIEFARMVPSARIFAIEKNEDAFKTLRKNVETLRAWNVEPVFAEAPEVFDSLPNPSKVFIGGSGGKLKLIFQKLLSLQSLRILVASFVTLPTLSQIYGFLRESRCTEKFQVELLQLGISRVDLASIPCYFKPLNPVFILKLKQKEFESE